MAKAITFKLPPSERCVIQRGTVVIDRSAAAVIMDTIAEQMGLRVKDGFYVKIQAPSPDDISAGSDGPVAGGAEGNAPASTYPGWDSHRYGGDTPPPNAESDLFTCPGCGGPADNGIDRSLPPNVYYCTSCQED